MKQYALQRASRFLADTQITYAATALFALALSVCGLFPLPPNRILIVCIVVSADCLIAQIMAMTPAKLVHLTKYIVWLTMVSTTAVCLCLLWQYTLPIVALPLVAAVLYPDKRLFFAGALTTLLLPFLTVTVARTQAWTAKYWLFMSHLTDASRLPDAYYEVNWDSEIQGTLMMFINIVIPIVIVCTAYIPILQFIHSQQSDMREIEFAPPPAPEPEETKPKIFVDELTDEEKEKMFGGRYITK